MHKVNSIETFLVDLPTIRPHVLSMATMHRQTIVIVRIHCSDGIIGIGEGTTIGGLSYGEESPESIKLAIDTYFEPILKTCDPARVGQTMAKIGKVVVGNHFAKSAVETALLDAMGKRVGLPVSELLGGRHRDELPVAWTLASGDTAKDIGEAERVLDLRRHNIFKLKIGKRSVADDVAHVASSRRRSVIRPACGSMSTKPGTRPALPAGWRCSKMPEWIWSSSRSPRRTAPDWRGSLPASSSRSWRTRPCMGRTTPLTSPSRQRLMCSPSRSRSPVVSRLPAEWGPSPGKEDELASLLSGAQPLAEAEEGTVTWFAFKVDEQTYGIFDAFGDDAARQAHLDGQIAAALMDKADELLASPPDIKPVDLLGSKLP